MPTLYPSFESPQAKFAVMVDFPTPPFPEAIAITCFIFCNGLFFSLFGAGFI